jgi:hypothetical protein
MDLRVSAGVGLLAPSVSPAFRTAFQSCLAAAVHGPERFLGRSCSYGAFRNVPAGLSRRRSSASLVVKCRDYSQRVASTETELRKGAQAGRPGAATDPVWAGSRRIVNRVSLPARRTTFSRGPSRPTILPRPDLRVRCDPSHPQLNMPFEPWRESPSQSPVEQGAVGANPPQESLRPMYRYGEATLESNRVMSWFTDGASRPLRRQGSAESLRSNTERGGTRSAPAHSVGHSLEFLS